MIKGDLNPTLVESEPLVLAAGKLRPPSSADSMMRNVAPLYVIVAATMWGIDGVLLRPTLYSMPVTIVVLLESLLATAILTPFLYKHLAVLRVLGIKDWLAFAGVAILGGAIGTMAITKALFYVDFVNLSVVVLIQKLQPVFAMLFAALFLRERLEREYYVWAGLAIAGGYVMTFGTSWPNLGTGDKTMVAALYALAAAVSFSASTVLSKRALRNVSFEIGTYLRFLLSTIVLLAVVASLQQIAAVSSVTLSQFGILLLIACTTGGAAIFFYYYGLKHITASVSTICELAFPLTAVVLEYLVRDNLLRPAQWFGVALLLFSIMRVTQLNHRSLSTAARTDRG